MPGIIDSTREKNFYYALNRHHEKKGWVDAPVETEEGKEIR